jgi:hypothetical protein
MSFWDKSPGPSTKHYIKSLFSAPFEPQLLINTNNMPGALGIRKALPEDIPALIAFWIKCFRKPHSPISQHDPEDLRSALAEGSIILLKESEDGTIIGTVMSRRLGQLKRVGISSSWSSFRMRWIDMFCVHHKYWHQGISSQLLHQLYKEHEAVGDYACYFLKEGSPLKMPALRSSFYVYRYAKPAAIQTSRTEVWTSQQFITFAESLPPHKTNTLIHSLATGSPSSLIVHYKGYKGTITAAFHKCPEVCEGKPIIWCTGVLKVGLLMDVEVDDAMLKLSDVASNHFNSPYIWVDGKHLVDWKKNGWQYDGPFHIYAYHVDTGVYFNGDPFLIL